MTATTFDNPDWESQLRDMMGEDAPDMIKRFQGIINEHYDNLDQPVATVEIACSQEDVHRWLPAIHGYLNDGEYDEETFREIVWNLGFELSRIYLTTDEVEQDDACSDTTQFFWSTLDDEADDEDEE